MKKNLCILFSAISFIANAQIVTDYQGHVGIDCSSSSFSSIFNVSTNGHYNASSYAEANACMTSNDRNDLYFNRLYRVFVHHIEEQTARWSVMYDNVKPPYGIFIGKVQASSTEESGKGTVSIYVTTTLGKFLGGTFEGFNGISIDGTSIVGVHSPTSIKMNSENIGNFIIQILKEYSNI